MALALQAVSSSTVPRYATDPDIVAVLGKIGPRLPAEIAVATFGAIAHAETVDRLGEVYGDNVPAFTGNALEAVRWAEAKLAAAEILEALRASLPDVGETPVRLRQSAERTLSSTIPGAPAGGGTATDASGAAVAYGPTPLARNNAPGSLIVDPYSEAW